MIINEIKSERIRRWLDGSNFLGGWNKRAPREQIFLGYNQQQRLPVPQRDEIYTWHLRGDSKLCFNAAQIELPVQF